MAWVLFWLDAADVFNDKCIDLLDEIEVLPPMSVHARWLFLKHDIFAAVSEGCLWLAGAE